MEYLLGKQIAQQMKEYIGNKVLLKKRKPVLFVLLNSNDESSNGYVSMIKRTALEVGIEVLVEKVSSLEEYEKCIARINGDNSIDSCLITRPLVKGCDENYVFSLLDVKKDVDAVNYHSLGKIVVGDEKFVPNTSLAIIKLLECSNIELTGKKVLVVGRSLSVGKPTALLLLNRNATVTIAHSKTKNLNDELKNYDIVIGALGKPHFIDAKYMKEGAVAIDAGIHYLDSGIVGDIKPNKKLSFISKVPGGIGVITTSCLLRNVLVSYEENTNDY